MVSVIGTPFKVSHRSSRHPVLAAVMLAVVVRVTVAVARERRRRRPASQQKQRKQTTTSATRCQVKGRFRIRLTTSCCQRVRRTCRTEAQGKLRSGRLELALQGVTRTAQG